MEPKKIKQDKKSLSSLKQKLFSGGASVIYGGKSFAAPPKKSQKGKACASSSKGPAISVPTPRRSTPELPRPLVRGGGRAKKTDEEILAGLEGAPAIPSGPSASAPILDRTQAAKIHKSALLPTISPDIVHAKRQELLKIKAVKKFQEKLNLNKADPNYSRSMKIQTEKSLNFKVEATTSVPTGVVSRPIGTLDLSSPKVQAMLKRGSSHAHEVERVAIEKEESYFENLEAKEETEKKLQQIKAIVCDVVSCAECDYTAESAPDRCTAAGHAVRRHRAAKRFFECETCRKRCFAFTRMPKRPCRTCDTYKYRQCSMIPERKGPKLDQESFNIATDPKYFLNL
ncbi:hypothetical protein JTE90_002185 [Oedothorax gibbosus]|uniref:Replication factor Mcm10 C-terminal domain-containing protein n=1 Tax=Oedothorax gibbosus TaxID=931172 RepID=A0AAV6VFQ1_9ARAC|nr:hypothetical protein JTE90_002185 [Oedothorax gibbosus]